MGNPIDLDYRLAMECAAGRGGLTEAQLEAVLMRASAAVPRIVARAEAGELGFFRLPADASLVTESSALAASLPASLTDALVLGVGGSSLGARAAFDALAPRGREARGAALHFPDNADPHRLAELLATLDPRATLVIVVSKSGGTLETAAQALLAFDWLERALGVVANDHIVAITDPESGSLRALVRERGLRSLPIPSNVGGRFSVLTAAGLFPLALAGIDIAALMAGARDAMHACETPDAAKNPAALFAALHVAHMEAKGHLVHVFMPYSDALRTLGGWFVQLWAESLGKRFDRAGKVVERGPTPVAAVGSTDQHAQVQLFVEGPRDKLVCLLRVARATSTDLVIPPSDGPLAFLAGRSMHEVVVAQLEGTALALACDDRPSLTLGIETLDAHALGALFFTLEAATAIAGELLDVDAFDQPGVERGKRITLGMLGQANAETDAARARLSRADARHRLPPG